jgi:hypothetical protein
MSRDAGEMQFDWVHEEHGYISGYLLVASDQHLLVEGDTDNYRIYSSCEEAQEAMREISKGQPFRKFAIFFFGATPIEYDLFTYQS